MQEYLSMMSFNPKKIISGGQTGADIAGLVAAKRCGIVTGGNSTIGYRTENGPQPEVLKQFGLVEYPSKHYRHRTKENVAVSAATLIFADNPDSDGTKLTIKCCIELNKPYLVVSPWGESELIIREFLDNTKPDILNIAGNRESKSPGIAKQVAAVLCRVLLPT